jgi:hypothetical protein
MNILRACLLMCFSAVLFAQPPQAVYVSPGYGTGMSATLTFRVAVPSGWSDFENLYITLRPASSNPLPFTNGCDLNYVSNYPYTPSLVLVNDSDTAAAQYVLEGQSVVTISGQTNSYCSILGAPTHTAVVNGAFSFTISLAFKPTMYGGQAIFTDGIGFQSGESGFASFQPGWTVGAPVTATMTSPASGTRLTGTSFTLGLSQSTYQPELFIGTAPGRSDVFQGWVYDGQTIQNLPDTLNFGNAPLSALYLTLVSWTDSNTTMSIPYTLLPAAAAVVSATFAASPPIYVTDDYSGQTVQIPTADNPYVNPDVYISPPQELFGQGGYYNLIIEHARPNAPVWALATNSQMLNAGSSSPQTWSWCPSYPYFPRGSYMPATGACLLGATGPDGYFASSYVTNGPKLGDTVTKVWVGPITPDPTDPIGQTSVQTDDSLFVGSVYFFVQDSSGNPPFSPFSAARKKAHTLSLSDGRRVELPVSSKIEVSSASSAFKPEGGGYRYDLTLDTRTAQVIRIGRDLGYRGNASAAGAPSGWLQTKVGLIALPESERSDKSKVSLTSDWKPGPIPLYFQGPHEAFPMQEKSHDNVSLARATSILRTATQKIVIGPAIKPAISEAELRLLVRNWKDALGFSFLAPLLASSDFSAGIDLLKPSTDMERSIVQCLRDAK